MFEDQQMDGQNQLPPDGPQRPMNPDDSLPSQADPNDLDSMQVPSSSTTSFSQVQPMQTPRGLGASSPVGSTDIKTMPERFIPGQSSMGMASGRVSKPASGRRLLIIVGVVAVVMAAATAGAYFYLNSTLSPFAQTPTPDNANANTNVSTTTPANENVDNTNTNVTNTEDAATVAARDQQRLTDLTAIAKALEDFRARYGAYPQFLSLIPQDIAQTIPVDPKTQRQYAYTPTNDRQSYILVFDVESGVSFKGQQLTTGEWQLYPKNFNENTNEPANENTNVNTNTNTTTDLPNLDADGDGLTAAEETVFTTSAQLADSDADGFTDAVEIKNFYSPMSSGSVRLDAAGLVKLHSSTEPAYSFYYPASWLVNQVDSNPRDILITSTSGENFSFKVENNPEKLSSWDWYVKNVSGTYDKSSVSIVQIAGKEAVKTLDGLSAYIASGTITYVIKYNVNSAATINYPSIFNLLLDRLVIS